VTEVYERPVAFEVSVWPPGHGACIDSSTWCVTVADRGRGKWAVLRGGSGSKACLSSDGKWEREPIPSERDDDWLAAHRYSLDDALRLAREHAPKVTLNGLTAVEVLALDQRNHPEGCHD